MSKKRGRLDASDQILQGSDSTPEPEDDGTWNSFTQPQRLRALCSALPGDSFSPELQAADLRIHVVTGHMAG